MITAQDWESAVDATAGIDQWCSGPDWCEPVAAAFASGAEPTTLDCGPAGLATLARYADPGEGFDDETGDIISGREPLWGFASPVAGPDVRTVAKEVAKWLGSQTGWTRCILPGLPDDGELLRVLAIELQHLGELQVAEGITRQVADLSQGLAAWESRRSSSFRRNLRNASRRASQAGLSITDLDPGLGAPEVFERILQIEYKSWKGQQGDGITSPEMSDFYRLMLQRLVDRGRLRGAIAQLDGQDVGFIIGGVRRSVYRGLQLSYTADVASLSVSHLLQQHQVRRLCQDGVDTYDMGMDMDYKQRWADRANTSVVLVLAKFSP